MKLINLIVPVLILLMLGTVAVSACTGNFELVEKKRGIRRKTESLEFISESFRLSCNGKGFENLDEWKLKNSLLWNLDEIGWEKKGNVFRGFWKGPAGNGEVVYRTVGYEKGSES